MTATPAFPANLDDSYAYHLAQGTWPEQELESLHVEYAPSIDVPAHVRALARGLLAAHITPAQLVDTLLMLSELVGNAISHPVPQADERVVVHLAFAAGQIRAEVCDGGDGFELDDVAEPAPGAAGNRGLPILDVAASRWGVSADAGHCVWFELDR
jgi:anti-sigma regulatory factor (Ser/Thr protein kinase)